MAAPIRALVDGTGPPSHRVNEHALEIVAGLAVPTHPITSGTPDRKPHPQLGLPEAPCVQLPHLTTLSIIEVDCLLPAKYQSATARILSRRRPLDQAGRLTVVEPHRLDPAISSVERQR